MYTVQQIIHIKMEMVTQQIGATTGCHCHFTLRKDGDLIDPRTILKQKEGVMI